MKKILPALVLALGEASCGSAPVDSTPIDTIGELEFLPYQYEYFFDEYTTVYFKDAAMTIVFVEKKESYAINVIDGAQFELIVNGDTSLVHRLYPGVYVGVFREQPGLVDLGCSKEVLVNLFLYLKDGEVFYPQGTTQTTSATLPRKYVAKCH